MTECNCEQCQYSKKWYGLISEGKIPITLGDEMDEEINKILENSGDEILIKIMDLRNKVVEDNYIPKSLIIWEGYYEMLCNASNLKYSNCKVGIANKILGLNIITTQIPDILEVY